MGTELVSACVFCAGLLGGASLSPRPGPVAEIGVAYSTFARSLPSSRGDLSDVTPKFLLIGFGHTGPARGDLGAGTPGLEWRVRVALAPSHDEQEQAGPPRPGRTVATGTGRYENYALLGRFPVGPRDSVEAAVERRTHKATDLINSGGENYTFSEERVLSSERVDAALGLRHRWKELEVSAAVRYARPSGSNATAGAFYISEGSLWGAEVGARWRRGNWTLALGAERMAGSIGVHEESAPAFASRDFTANGSLESVRLFVGYSWSRTDLFLSGAYDRQRLPFVALAVLGSETAAFDSGFHPDSRAREMFWDVGVRHAFTPAVRGRISVRLGYGRETVTLSNALGPAGPRRLEVGREGVFGRGLSRALGAPEATLLFGAEFSVGSTP